MHLTVLFSHFGKSKTFSNFKWCGDWNNGVVESWTTWFLDFNKRGTWSKRGGAKFGPFLINLVAKITELWEEKSQKISCRDVTSIWEGRVIDLNNNSKEIAFRSRKLKGIIAKHFKFGKDRDGNKIYYKSSSCMFFLSGNYIVWVYSCIFFFLWENYIVIIYSWMFFFLWEMVSLTKVSLSLSNHLE